MQLESRILLPDYIAIRFNLRIQHVHRGILLGTGPLVDPGYRGDLLIPLHNLTASEYRIPVNQGLIWVEFTKTSRKMREAAPSIPASERDDTFAVKIPPDRKVEEFFEKANRNRPIESSIPGEIASVKETSRRAQADAKAAKRTNQIFTTITFISVLSVVVSLLSFLQGSSQRIEGLAEKANKASDQVSDLKKSVEALQGPELKRTVDGLSEQVRAVGVSQADSKAEADRSSAAVAAMTTRLDALAAAVRALDAHGTEPKRRGVQHKRHRRKA